jgi:hypothetical protein
LSSSKSELVLDAGDLSFLSSEEELFGPVVVAVMVLRGWREVGVVVVKGEGDVEERWRRERVLLRLRRDFISREGIS